MKKLILLFTLCMCCVLTLTPKQASAQRRAAAGISTRYTGPTVVSGNFDPKKWLKRIEASEEAIGYPKKMNRAATWLDRGDFFQQVYYAPTEGVYPDMEVTMLQVMYGKKSQNKRINNKENVYTRMSYEYFDAYILDKKLVYWIPTWEISQTALETAVAAYLKAYELDAKQEKKIKAGLEKIGETHSTLASQYYTTNDSDKAVVEFVKAYETKLLAPLNIVDTMSIFYAGYISMNEDKHEQAAKYLEMAKEIGKHNEGEIFMYLFHCYYALKDNAKAIDILLQGMVLYPEKKELTNALLALCSTDENMDIKDVEASINKALALDPNNSDLYNGLGGVYDKLGDLDKAMECFKKGIELKPQDFRSNFNLGLTYLKVADKMHEDLNSVNKITAKEYNQKVDEINKVYFSSLEPLEMAFSQKQDDVVTAELLKNLYFRLRNEDGMMEKHEKYKAIYEALTK
ncbi:MAG: tetratricopeptide repeat protein [Rikenellaceae bacterium]